MTDRSSVRTRGILWFLITGIPVLSSVSLGCAGTYMESSAFYRMQATELLQEASSIEESEASDPVGAQAKWAELLSRVANLESTDFPGYRQRLADSLESLPSRRRSDPSLGEDAARGLPDIYFQSCKVYVAALRGLARTYLQLGDAERAKSFAIEAVDFAKARMLTSFARDESIRDSQTLLAKIAITGGQVREAAVARVSARIVENFLKSRRGADSYFAHMAVIEGEDARSQTGKIEEYFDGIWRENRAIQQAQAAQMAGMVMAVNSAAQSVAAQSMLASNSGMMTPQIQSLQQNAAMSQMYSQLSFAMSERAMAEVVDTSLSVESTPWASDSFSLQLADPEAGNPYPIIREFAEEASQLAPEGSVTSGANALIRAADRAEKVRNSSTTPQRIAESVTGFAESFNDFLKVFAVVD